MTNYCIICKKYNNLKFIDDYKFEVESDLDFFGNLKIYGCKDCKIYFANPLPEPEKLNSFYSNIYRAPGRPHNHEYNMGEENLEDDRFLNYLSYLTTFIDFNKINNIFDFGAGIGDLGYLIKKNFQHINLHCCENDKFSLEILKRRGYQNYSSLEKINNKFDLIISLHTIEHLTSLDPVFELKTKLVSGGYFFFEVPNCPFDKSFINRPYDSPHIIFFTKESWYNISKLLELNLVDLTYASYSLDEAFKAMSESKDRFKYWKKDRLTFRDKLRKIIPPFILKLRRKIIQFNKKKNLNRSKNFVNNNENSWCIRGILKNEN